MKEKKIDNRRQKRQTKHAKMQKRLRNQESTRQASCCFTCKVSKAKRMSCNKDSEDNPVSVMVSNPKVLDFCNCYEPLSIPVFQCDSGHIVCSTCCMEKISYIGKRKHEQECIHPKCYCPTFGSFEPLKQDICITPMMQIFVKGMDGKTFTLSVKSSDTIIDVKEKIFDRDKIAVHDQGLIYSGAQLDDNLTLANCNIQDSSTLHLVLRVLGD